MGMKLAFLGHAPEFKVNDQVTCSDDIRVGDIVVFERESAGSVVVRALQPDEIEANAGLLYRVEQPAQFDHPVYVQIVPSSPGDSTNPAVEKMPTAHVTNLSKPDSFPIEVIERLKNYVYRLIDPRNGETFYVGRGTGNRVFAHVKGQIEEGEDEPDAKLKRIWEIHAAGFDVAHVIHRHGMDGATAVEVEAALIDAYPGLTNIAGGSGSGDFGVMHAKEVIDKYSAQPAVFRHRALLININRTAGEKSLYDATRYAWVVGDKAEQAQVILAVKQGIIRGAFVAEEWLPATVENFPHEEGNPDRMGFIGQEASAEMQQLYVGKRVPEKYRKQGAANPIRYTW